MPNRGIARTLEAKGESPIVVSQTRAEVKAINDSVRSHLRESGMLAGTDASASALEQIDLTASQKMDARHYPSESCLMGTAASLICARQ